jgi:hypothetical protein
MNLDISTYRSRYIEIYRSIFIDIYLARYIDQFNRYNSVDIYRVATWGLFLGTKGPEREANNCHSMQW